MPLNASNNKKCSKCLELKPLTEFYRNKITSDGRGSWCISCEKKRDRKAYSKKYRNGTAYIKAQEKYRFSPKGVKNNREYLKKARKVMPEKLRARDKVKYALRTGVLKKPSQCEKCLAGNLRLHAHHEDYSKPLEVIWLCPECHTILENKAVML